MLVEISNAVILAVVILTVLGMVRILYCGYILNTTKNLFREINNSAWEQLQTDLRAKGYKDFQAEMDAIEKWCDERRDVYFNGLNILTWTPWRIWTEQEKEFLFTPYQSNILEAEYVSSNR